MKTRFTTGTTSELDAHVGLNGSLSVDTEKKQLRVHDGVNPGGVVVSGVQAAPIDGKLYVQKDGDWVEFIAGYGVQGSGNYFVATRTSDAGQIHVFEFAQVQYNFDLHGYALLQQPATPDQTVTLLPTADNVSPTTYTLTQRWIVTSNGVEPYNKTKKELTVADNTLEVPVGGINTLTITSSVQDLSSLDPAPNGDYYLVTKNTTPSYTWDGYTITQSSTYRETDYSGYLAFNRDLGAVDGCWLSSARATVSVPQWLGVEIPLTTFPGGAVLSAYHIANRNHAPTTGSPIDFELQGSEDGVTWFTIHSVTGRTNLAAGAEDTYTVASHSPVRYFRIFITASSATETFTGLSMLDLYATNIAGKEFLIKDTVGQYYSVANGVFTAVATPSVASDYVATGTTESGVIDGTTLDGFSGLTLETGEDTFIDMTAQSRSQLIRSSETIPVVDWQQLHSLVVNGDFTNANVGIAMSRDGVDWQVWDGAAWVSIGTIANDQASADTTLSQGMSIATVEALTDVEWSAFYSATDDGSPDQLWLAVSLQQVDATLTVPYFASFTANVDYAGPWIQQTPAEVEVAFTNTHVQFTPAAAGTYKFAWQEV